MLFQRGLLVALCSALVAMSSAAPEASKKTNPMAKIRSGEVASRAVNLGGWLVAEHWMSNDSPLWDGLPEDVASGGEYAVMQYLGRAKGEKAFEAHWSTWITEDDLKQISKTGLNTVRVTVGYWIVNDEDDSESSTTSKSFARGGLKYLDLLINKWAVKYNLAVMVSLHAHEGSQNGMDHSAPTKMWETGWGDSPAYAKSSLLVATFIANRYAKSEAFVGLNLMNEPTNPIEYSQLYEYYEAAYQAIRAEGNDCIIVTSPLLSNQGGTTMQDYMPCPKYTNVWHEFHVYYKWGWENTPKDSIFTQAATYKASHFDMWTGNPVFLGEWSLATPDEAPLSNAELTEFAAIQMKEAEGAQAGWAFWAWRHDEEKNITSPWSMRQLLREGIITIPQYPATRTREAGSKCPTKGAIDVELLEEAAPDVPATESGSGSDLESPSSALFKPINGSSSSQDKPDTTESSSSTPEPSSARSAMRLGASLLSFAVATVAVWML